MKGSTGKLMTHDSFHVPLTRALHGPGQQSSVAMLVVLTTRMLKLQFTAG